MDYKYDIFISYKRGSETNQWIQQHFEPLLIHSVGLELGYAPSVFRDNRLDDGGSWPVDLGVALGSSKVLVSLWTKTYFYSEWCVREMAAMLEREKHAGYRTATRPAALVLPSVLHDCDPVPKEVAHIQHRVLRDFFNVRMRPDSTKAELLADAIALAAPAIAKSIENAPAWQEDWPRQVAEQFMQEFYKGQAPRQATVPGFSG
jgi:hypothetical protein